MFSHRETALVLAPVRVPAPFLATPDPNHDGSKEFKEARRNVAARQQMRCAGCGYTDIGTAKIPHGMIEMHHLDHNHANKDLDNLVAVCPMCHDVLHIGFAPDHHRGEVLIGDDHCTQVELIRLCRTLMVAAFNQQQYAEAARQMYDTLRERLWQTTRRFMPADYDGTVATFGAMLQSEQFAAFVPAAESTAALSRVRYLPALSGYPTAIEHYARVTNYATIPEVEWAGYATP